jgi:hypothetical protein
VDPVWTPPPTIRKSWCRAPDIYYSLTVTVLFLWGALSDERMGLSFVYAAGPGQRSLSRARVPWVSRLYFTVSVLRLPFRHLLRLAGSRWRYSNPPRHGSTSSNLHVSKEVMCCIKLSLKPKYHALTFINMWDVDIHRHPLQQIFTVVRIPEDRGSCACPMHTDGKILL